MNDTFITFHGWAGSDVRHRIAKDVSVANLRVASTPRIRRDGAWVDGETTWYSVTAWRGLADNLQMSVRKGDPVIVHGRLRTETWTAEDGTTSTTLQVDALLVGHDLNRGLSHFMKPRRPETAAPQHDAAQGPDPLTPPSVRGEGIPAVPPRSTDGPSDDLMDLDEAAPDGIGRDGLAPADEVAA